MSHCYYTSLECNASTSSKFTYILLTDRGISLFPQLHYDTEYFEGDHFTRKLALMCMELMENATIEHYHFTSSYSYIDYD